MSVGVRIPRTLRPLTDGSAFVMVEGSTVEEILDGLVSVHPDVREHIIDGDGRVHRFVNVFLGDEDIRLLDGLATHVSDGQSISIIPAVAGGSGS